jgi:hypothetical protein
MNSNERYINAYVSELHLYGVIFMWKIIFIKKEK